MSKDKGLRLHPEHGVNPMIQKCAVCGDSMGLLLLGYNDGKEAPREAAIPGQRCDTCIEHGKLGIILIEVKDGSQGPNPYRTGRLFVITEEAAEKLFHGPEVETIKRPEMRVAYVEESAVKATGIDKVTPSMGQVEKEG
jgi:hypothetical protein